jgi:hypothetical protein
LKANETPDFALVGRLDQLRDAGAECARTLAYAVQVSQVAHAVYTTQNTLAWKWYFDARHAARETFFAYSIAAITAVKILGRGRWWKSFGQSHNAPGASIGAVP